MKPFAVALCCLLASCSGGFDAQGTVTFWSPRPDFSLSELAAKTPGLKVLEAPHKPWKDLLAGSSAPDLLVLETGLDADEARSSGLLADLTPYVPRLQSAKSWWPSLGLPRQGAPLTVLPASVYLWGFFYNPSVLKAAGVEPPRSWQALLDTLAALRAHGKIPIAVGASFGWPALAWLSALDLRLNGADAHRSLIEGKRPFNDRGMMTVYATLADWKAKGWFDAKATTQNWPEALAEVSSGQAGFVLLGAFGLTRANDAKLAFLPLPDKPGVSQGDLASVQGFAVAAKSKSAEAAVRLADLAITAGAPGQAETFRSPAVPVTASGDFQKWQRDRLEHDSYVALLLDQTLPRARAETALQTLTQFFGERSQMTPAELATRLSASGRAP
jgi:ABC-type glycerol-3-phosphate transport system substrate-binding protein